MKEPGRAMGSASKGPIRDSSGSTARDAILGALVGGAAGAAIGTRMDRQAGEIQAAVPDALVERVGEGIQVTFVSRLLFDLDSDTVRNSATFKLDLLAANLSGHDDASLLIVGHTDDVGSAKHNQAFSAERAESAARYLKAHGVGCHIETAGLGEREPVTSNSTEAGRLRNRRVEIAIHASTSVQRDAKRRGNGD